jgi:hypothetical protein
MAATAPSQTTATIADGENFIEVTFDNVPAGYTLDANSVLDLAAEFTIGYTGLKANGTAGGSASLVATSAPLQVDGDTFRFEIAGDFKADGTQSVSLTWLNTAWSFWGRLPRRCRRSSIRRRTTTARHRHRRAAERGH